MMCVVLCRVCDFRCLLRVACWLVVVVVSCLMMFVDVVCSFSSVVPLGMVVA